MREMGSGSALLGIFAGGQGGLETRLPGLGGCGKLGV